MDAGLAAYGHGWPIAAGPVGASLLAMVVNDDAGHLTPLASKLAPTGFSK